MLITSGSFPTFIPASPIWSPCSPSVFNGCGLMESFTPSGRAGMLMMLHSLGGIVDSWPQGQGSTFLPCAAVARQPVFGSPAGGKFRPLQCFLGLDSHEPQSKPVARRVKRPAPRHKRNYGIRPLRQSNSSSCGQTSVAMAVNRLTGKSLKDTDIANNYGYGLLSALNGESKGAGYRWRDGGNFSPSKWKLLEKKLNQEKTPVIMGLNGSFSPSGRGHIITLLAVEGDKVKYADPADGTIKTTSRQAIENAPGHPQGKFFFYASKHA